VSDEFEIAHASYGKADVSALSWVRTGSGDTVREVSLRLVVEGAFVDSYRSGDNRAVLPSETLRRHALRECEQHPDAAPEELAQLIAARLLATNPAFDSVTVDGRVTIWRPTAAHCFTREPWWATVGLRLDRVAAPQLTSGVAGLTLLLTAGSSFTGFLRDELTDQPESTDRPLLGTVEASWTYRAPALAAPDEMATQLTSALADRTTNSIQQLLTAAGAQLLRANDELATVQLSFSSTALAETSGGIFSSDARPAGVTSVELRRGP
jgi:urate oxidase